MRENKRGRRRRCGRKETETWSPCFALTNQLITISKLTKKGRKIEKGERDVIDGIIEWKWVDSDCCWWLEIVGWLLDWLVSSWKKRGFNCLAWMSSSFHSALQNEITTEQINFVWAMLRWSSMNCTEWLIENTAKSIQKNQSKRKGKVCGI